MVKYIQGLRMHADVMSNGLNMPLSDDEHDEVKQSTKQSAKDPGSAAHKRCLHLASLPALWLAAFTLVANLWTYIATTATTATVDHSLCGLLESLEGDFLADAFLEAASVNETAMLAVHSSVGLGRKSEGGCQPDTAATAIKKSICLIVRADHP